MAYVQTASPQRGSGVPQQYVQTASPQRGSGVPQQPQQQQAFGGTPFAQYNRAQQPMQASVNPRLQSLDFSFTVLLLRTETRVGQAIVNPLSSTPHALSSFFTDHTIPFDAKPQTLIPKPLGRSCRVQRTLGCSTLNPKP
jgi:hypothetical protein